MKLLFALVAVLPFALAAIPQQLTLDPAVELFQAWKSMYNREYETESEEVSRFTIWKENMEIVKKHNIEYDLGLVTFTLGMNEFADLRNDEFVAMRTGHVKTLKRPVLDHKPIGGSVPDSIDWRTYGYVTGVKNQGSCGSCWAFSTTGGLEGQHMNASGTLVSLSEEQLVECDGYDNGCNGGNMVTAYKYLSQYGSISEEDYPYTSANGQSGSCESAGKPIAATVSSSVSLPFGNEDILKEVVGTVGPVSVAIDASKISFQLYKSGVYYSSSCSQFFLDHGVLAAGYGTYSGEDYWLVKNSWGTSWGMDGYIMMARNKNNNCGIASDACYPVV